MVRISTPPGSRTVRLLDELAASLQNADKVLVAEVFRAGEGPPRPGEATAADLARQVRAGGAETFDAHGIEKIARLLETRLAAGDVLATLGAGDVCCKRLNLRIGGGYADALTLTLSRRERGH